MKLNIGGITEAGQSKKNKTGDWRYFRYIVNDTSCNGCGICEQFCPDSCIKLEEKLAVIDDLYCKGCGICARECPQEAITVQPEGVS